MFEVQVKAMRDNPGRDHAGDRSGLFMVRFREVGWGRAATHGPWNKVEKNLPYDVASEIAKELKSELNTDQ